MENIGEILRDLQKTSGRLDELIRGLDEKQLDRIPEDGGWTPRQIVHHLADGACIWSMFVRQALAGQGGDFNLGWYLALPQKEWAEIWQYSTREIGLSLELYRVSTDMICTLLESGGSGSEMELEIYWKDGQSETVSVRDVVDQQIEHLDRHLAEIRKILK